jgi:hypothetical protein
MFTVQGFVMNNCERQLSVINYKLKQKCHDLHRSILLHCCSVHGYHEEIAGLAEVIKKLDYFDGESVTSLLNAADSLVGTVYPTAALNYAVNQLASLIKKYPFPVTSVNDAAQKRAIAKFDEFEGICHRTNQIYSDPHHPMRASSDLLQRMRSFIAFVLGEHPDLEKIGKLCNFGPGASLGVHGNATNVKKKLLSRTWTVSSAARDYARFALKSNVQIVELLVDPERAASGDVSDLFNEQFDHLASIVDNNNIVFVPKTTLIKRSIAVEPLLNGFVQKGIDVYMRSLLMRRANIDLSDQSLNSSMARDGSYSVGDYFCTIDLSSASDSIAIEIVRELLPPDWFYLLDRTRSKSYKLDGDIKVFKKFCSMGNGFCFPLQTLLFAAACNAVGSGVSGTDFRSYGDDIIVRRSKFEPLVSLLETLGFVVNRAKTFSSGPFRESCGGDFYLGADVRPVQLDYCLDSVQALFKFHNSWYRSAICKCFSDTFAHILRERVPLRFRFMAPDYSGVTDQAFLVQKSSYEYLSSPHTAFSKKLWCTRWKELITQPVTDRNTYGRTEREVSIAYLYAALSGADSQSTFAYRRKTRTNIRSVAYG